MTYIDNTPSVLRQIARRTNDGFLRGPALDAADQIEALTAQLAEARTQVARVRAEEIERLRKRVEAADRLYRATEFLADNDPDDIVCDGGGTAILVGLSGIRSALAAYRAGEADQ